MNQIKSNWFILTCFKYLDIKFNISMLTLWECGPGSCILIVCHLHVVIFKYSVCHILAIFTNIWEVPFNVVCQVYLSIRLRNQSVLGELNIGDLTALIVILAFM
jgi:hypothetical protein